MIRQCKQNSPSPKKLRKIFAKKCGLYPHHTPLAYANQGLMEIITEFNLVKDFAKFIRDIEDTRSGTLFGVSPRSGLKAGWMYGPEISFEEAFMKTCISVIRLTLVKNLPGYRRPAKFRNHED